MNDSAFKKDVKGGYIEKESANYITNNSLQKIARGTGIIFIGTIVGMLLGLVGRIVVVRYISQSEYGIYSLAIVMISIFATISTMGLKEGLARNVAYFRGRNEKEKIRGAVYSSIWIILISSLVLSSILFLTSNLISKNIFNSSELSLPLKIFSIAVPFIVLSGILASIFRGYDRVEPRTYFENILRNALFILFVVGVVLLDLSFIGVVYGYLAAAMVTCVAFVAYAMKKLPVPIFSIRKDMYGNNILKELLFFSLPILAISVLNLVLGWTDTLMLGYFKTSDVVGLYNGALPLARLIIIAFSSASMIYIPIASGLYSRNLIKEMRRIYQVLTKWILSVSIPIALIFILFPETVLNFIFGVEYVQAVPALRILSLGFISQIFLGLNGSSLVVMGKTKFLMFSSLFGAIFNVVLNVVLIPDFGIGGAAIASITSFWIVGILNLAKIYHFSKIHPFTRNYMKPLVISIILTAIIYASTSILRIEFWMIPIILFIFLFSYGILLLLTRSFDKEDIEILLIIEKKIGLNAKIIKRILNRFI